MAKGVKTIELYAGHDGVFYQKKSGGITTNITVRGDKHISFKVMEWLPNTSEDEKQEDVYWIRQTQSRNIVLHKVKGKIYTFKIPKKLCGPYSFYIEASRSGNQDFKNRAGIYINGYSTPLIKASDWRAKVNGRDIKNVGDIGYGNLIYLWLNTEGLYNDKITVEIYNKARGDDDFILEYTNVEVNRGEVKLQIGNTYSWRSKISYWVSDIEEFYIKAKTSKGKYIKDHLGDDKHAIYLKIEDKIITKEVEVSTNITPTKVFEPEKNFAKDEPCKFTAIDITEQGSKGKISVFKEGQDLPLVAAKKNNIERIVYFDFDKAYINAETAKKLNNVLAFLLRYPGTTINLSGYACVIGTEEYNKKLSQKRSDAIKAFFAKGKLDPERIISVGYGEANISDEDSSENLNEKNYIEARRVDIEFNTKVHGALIYETIAASSEKNKKNITIDITDFATKDCFREANKHKEKIVVISPDAAEKEGGLSLEFPMLSTLSAFNPAPLQYIWPRYNLIKGGESKDAAANYNVHIHSCRYFFNAYSPAVVVKAYPDIKWDFHLFLNLSNSLAVKWQNLSPAQHKKMQSNAGKIGAEKRWKQTDIDFGVVLAAKWDKNLSTSNYGSNLDVTLKWEDKIKQFYKIFSQLKEASKIIAGKTKSTATKTVGKKFPLDVDVLPPNLCLGAEWQLERGIKKNIETKELGTLLKFYFKAEPLIGIELTFDLLNAAVASVASPAAALIFSEIRDWLKGDDEDEDTSGITIDLYLNLIVFGTIQIPALALQYNTASDTTDPNQEATLDATATIGLKLEAGLVVKAKAVVIVGEFYAQAYAKFEGKGSITFGHGLKYQSSKLVYRPKLMFDGVTAKVEIKAEIGLLIKKGWFEGDYNTNLVNFKEEYILFKPFDIVKGVEELTGLSANIALLG